MILATPTYNRFSECVELIKSAQSGSAVPEQIIVADNSAGKFPLWLHDNNIDDLGNTLIIRMPDNYGCARAWNMMLRMAHMHNPDQMVVISNDDIKLHHDTLELFQNAWNERNSPVFCAGGISSPNAFSLFATSLARLEPYGLFDEFFLYPYCEDGDLARRLWLKGIELDRVEGASADHIGSATIAAYDGVEMHQHHIRFSRNAHYFQMKWGIDHNNIYSPKGYTEPFNGSEDDEALVKNFIRKQYGA